MANTGVLITGFGGPDSLDAVAPFMRNLMGREPSEELVERVRRRYLTIGGSSPLAAIARAFAEKLEIILAEIGKPMPVRIGMSYWHPFIDEGMSQLAALGCDRVITVSLSPFESKVSSGAYRESVEAAAERIGGIEVVEAPLIGELPEFAHYLAGACAASLNDIEPSDSAIVAFTAHSLPESDLVEGDPYVEGLERVAQSVAGILGMSEGAADAGEPFFDTFRAFGNAGHPRPWFLVYQSKGNKPGAWLGPDLDEFIDAAAASAAGAIVVCPIGFVTDHMETLYDLDVVAADRALNADLEFLRAPVPNEADVLVEAVAKAVAALA